MGALMMTLFLKEITQPIASEAEFFEVDNFDYTFVVLRVMGAWVEHAFGERHRSTS